MSQSDVAKRGGPSQTTVSDQESSAENGTPKMPTRKVVAQFARGLGLPLEVVERAAGYLPGAGRSAVPLSDVPEALAQAGMRPTWLSTGDVVYLMAEDSAPEETLAALEAFLIGWRQGREARSARQPRKSPNRKKTN